MPLFWAGLQFDNYLLNRFKYDFLLLQMLNICVI